MKRQRERMAGRRGAGSRRLAAAACLTAAWLVAGCQPDEADLATSAVKTNTVAASAAAPNARTDIAQASAPAIQPAASPAAVPEPVGPEAKTGDGPTLLAPGR